MKAIQLRDAWNEMFEIDFQSENFKVIFLSTNRKSEYKDLEAKIDKG